MYRLRAIFISLGCVIALSGAMTEMALAQDPSPSPSPSASPSPAASPASEPPDVIPPSPVADRPGYVPGQLIVKLRVSAWPRSLQQLNQQIGVSQTTPLFRPPTAAAARLQRPSSTTTEESRIGLERIYVVEVPPDANIPALAQQYAADPAVEYAEPNYLVHTDMVPDDPYWSSRGSWGQDYDDLWGLKKIEADQAWDLSQGEGVVVAVIDSGVDYTHEDLAANMWINQKEDINQNGTFEPWPSTEIRNGVSGDLDGLDNDGNGYPDDVVGFNTLNNDPDPMDDLGHGTHLAGIIAAAGNNKKGVIGVAPHAKIMAIKGLPKEGEGDIAALARAIRYAADNGAQVLSNSWGLGPISRTLQDDIDYATDVRHAMIVFSAGNGYRLIQGGFPAGQAKVITVASSDEHDEKSDFSNYGQGVDVAAPGGGSDADERVDLPVGKRRPYVNILSLRARNTDLYLGRATGYVAGDAIVGDKYYRARGTSMACPYVAGVAALIKARYPNLAPDQVKRTIQATADDAGTLRRSRWGFGRINAWNALTAEIAVTVPLQHSFVKGELTITGSADFGAAFQRYELWLVPSETPQQAMLLTRSTTPVRDGALGTWNTTASADGPYTLLLTVMTKNGQTHPYPTAVVVDNVNQEPSFVNLPNAAMVIGRANALRVHATDPDDPSTPWGQLRYEARNLPVGAQFDAEHGLLSWTPTKADKGRYAVTFLVSDNEHTVQQTVTLSTVVIKEERLTTTGNPYAPGISGTHVVWGADGTVHLYDLLSRADALISHPSESAGGPVIDHDKVVWSYSRLNPTTQESSSALAVYDLSTGRETLLTDYSAGRRIDRHLSQDRIAFAEYASDAEIEKNNGAIVVYNLTTRGKELRFQVNNPLRGIALGEQKLVWVENSVSDNADDHPGLYLHDFSTGQRRRLTTDPGRKYAPTISGENIVWEDERNQNQSAEEILDHPNDALYRYDLRLGKEVRLPVGSSGKGQLTSDGDKVVWLDWRNGSYYGDVNADVYLFDLSTNEELQVTSDQKSEWSPDISQNRIVWADGPQVQTRRDIYLATLYFYPVIDSVSSSGNVLTISGHHFGYDQDAKARVAVNGTALLEIMSWADNRITCVWPAGVQRGAVSVTTEGGTSTSLIYEPPRPDLAITQFFVEPPARGEVNGSQFTASAGQALHFTVTFPNQGSADCPAQTLRIDLDGARFAEAAIPPLPPGQMYTWVIPQTWQATAGTHQVTATVDARGEVTEADETNNQRTLTLVVARAPCFIPSRRLRQPVFRLPPVRRSEVRRRDPS